MKTTSPVWKVDTKIIFELAKCCTTDGLRGYTDNTGKDSAHFQGYPAHCALCQQLSKTLYSLIGTHHYNIYITLAHCQSTNSKVLEKMSCCWPHLDLIWCAQSRNSACGYSEMDQKVSAKVCKHIHAHWDHETETSLVKLKRDKRPECKRQVKYQKTKFYYLFSVFSLTGSWKSDAKFLTGIINMLLSGFI